MNLSIEEGKALAILYSISVSDVGGHQLVLASFPKQSGPYMHVTGTDPDLYTAKDH